MDANEFFADIGFSEWGEKLAEVDKYRQEELSAYKWRTVELLKNRVYSLPAGEDPNFEDMLAEFTPFGDSSVWLAVNDTHSAPNGISSFYVSEVNVIKEVIRQTSKYADLFFISPISALRMISEHGNQLEPLTNTLEHLQQWLRSADTPNVTLIYVDIDFIEGKSDARPIIQRFVERELK